MGQWVDRYTSIGVLTPNTILWIDIKNRLLSRFFLMSKSKNLVSHLL